MVVLQETRTCYFYIGTLDNVVLVQKKKVCHSLNMFPLVDTFLDVLEVSKLLRASKMLSR